MKTLTKLAAAIVLTLVFNLLQAQPWTNGTDISNTNTGNVGIGTTTPQAKLHVAGGLLLDGITGNTPVAGTGTRLMWIPKKAAFRAGIVGITADWDDVNIGQASFAAGYNTRASGSYTVALGTGTTASQYGAFAAGLGNTASGFFSLATGNYTAATARATASFGDYTVAQSYGSFVIGAYNKIDGNGTAWVPTDPLFVVGNGTGLSARGNALTLLKNGNLGLGILYPPSRLSILGGGNKTSGFSINNGDVHTCIYNQPVTNAGVIQVWAQGNANTIGNMPYSLQLQPDGGTVGIGLPATNSAYKLSVNGDIRAKRVVIETNWPDYVFEKDYKLKTLQQVDEFIQANGHLPEMPTQQEVKANGGDLGELVKLQMQKIEELTLYVIALNKKIEELSKTVKK